MLNIDHAAKHMVTRSVKLTQCHKVGDGFRHGTAIQPQDNASFWLATDSEIKVHLLCNHWVSTCPAMPICTEDSPRV